MFVGTKIGECQRKSNPSEWWWGPREHNPADMTTRVTPAEQLNEPKWQTGAEYLTKPVTVWPIRKDCNVDNLPDRVKITLVNDVS